MPVLREALLPFTVRNAARLRTYCELWKDVEVETVTSTVDLQRLPTLTKEIYRSELMYDADATSATEFISHSTGTTGALTWRHRTREESAIIARLFSAPPTANRQEQMPLTLVFRTSRHGMAIPMPARSRAMPIGMTDDEEVFQSLQVLTSEFRFQDGHVRPTAVAGGSKDVALLAQAVLESGVSGQHSIHQLGVGGYIDPALRQLLATAFPCAELFERYSLSEVFGGATRRPGSDTFVIDPYVVGEVLDDNDDPVAIGDVGELTLTELFPFVQAQPLVRYRTGDIVRRVSDAGGELAFEWWGRRSRCIRSVDDTSWMLGYSIVADELSQHDLVARQSCRTEITIISSTDLGPPCFTYEVDDDGVLDLEVGLRLSPWWAKASVDAIIFALWTCLRHVVLERGPATHVRLRFIHLEARTMGIRSSEHGRPGLSLPVSPLAGPPPCTAGHVRETD